MVRCAAAMVVEGGLAGWRGSSTERGREVMRIWVAYGSVDVHGQVRKYR